jgi:RNA polymerase sigma-70 factor, ECF subfamily
MDRITAARTGDPEALEALLLERRAEVVRYAMRLCVSPEDAEDATQEALLALARSIGALREIAALSRWLFLAVRTHCLRLARRSLRHALELDTVDDGGSSPGGGGGSGPASRFAVPLEGPSPEDQLVDRQLRSRLALVLAELGPVDRDVLLRRDVLGESAQEAAAALGITVEALKSRLHRARGEAKTRLLADLAARPKGRGRTAAPIAG